MAAPLVRSSPAFLRSSISKPSTSTPLPFSSLRAPPRSPLSGPRLPLPPSSAARSTASFLRRELAGLSSMLPLHSAVACARLVSRIPSEANSVVEGSYASYVSPI